MAIRLYGKVYKSERDDTHDDMWDMIHKNWYVILPLFFWWKSPEWVIKEKPKDIRFWRRTKFWLFIKSFKVEFRIRLADGIWWGNI